MTSISTTIMNRDKPVGFLPGIPLAEALLCISCDMIYPATATGHNTVCPSCTSNSYLKLVNILKSFEN